MANAQPRRFLAESLWHYRRSHLAVALGVAVATAVMTGAPLVGDSVRGSLHDLVLERLGAIDQVLVAQQPFRAKLAEELSATPGFNKHFGAAAPRLLLQATLSHRAGDLNRRANDVTLLGVTETFGRMNTHGPELEEAWEIPADEVWLTGAVAADLGVSVGDEVLVRLPTIEAIPSDSPLGEKSDTTIGRRMKVGRVLADEGLARFSLAPSQRPPRNAFVSLRTAQQTVELPGQANLLLLGWEVGEDASEWLRESLLPQLEDYGLLVESVGGGKALQIESKQLVLSEPMVRAAEQAFGVCGHCNRWLPTWPIR